jgi:hypothetical protein
MNEMAITESGGSMAISPEERHGAGPGAERLERRDR